MMSKAYFIGIAAFGIVAAICGLIVVLKSQEAFWPGMMLMAFGLLSSISTFFRYRTDKSSGRFKA
jgi:FtsH-binding integral membrane protein